MRKITIDVVCETGFAGSNHSDTLEILVADTATQEEIDEICDQETTEWATNLVSWSYLIKEVEDAGK